MSSLIALVLILAGGAAFVKALRMDRLSSFEDGTFLLQMALGVGGVVLVAAGLIVALFS
jgi:hypothetical protein